MSRSPIQTSSAKKALSFGEAVDRQQAEAVPPRQRIVDEDELMVHPCMH